MQDWHSFNAVKTQISGWWIHYFYSMINLLNVSYVTVFAQIELNSRFPLLFLNWQNISENNGSWIYPWRVLWQQLGKKTFWGGWVDLNNSFSQNKSGLAKGKKNTDLQEFWTFLNEKLLFKVWRVWNVAQKQDVPLSEHLSSLSIVVTEESEHFEMFSICLAPSLTPTPSPGFRRYSGMCSPSTSVTAAKKKNQSSRWIHGRFRSGETCRSFSRMDAWKDSLQFEAGLWWKQALQPNAVIVYLRLLSLTAACHSRFTDLSAEQWFMQTAPRANMWHWTGSRMRLDCVHEACTQMFILVSY